MGVLSTTSPAEPRKERVIRKIHKLHAQREVQRDLSHSSVLAAKNGRKRKASKPKPMPTPRKDRIVLLVRDPYWLQACWDITRQNVARAKAALAEHWHTCEPVLRLMQVEAGSTTSTSERMVREIPVHGGVKTGTSILKTRLTAIVWNSVTGPKMAAFSSCRAATW